MAFSLIGVLTVDPETESISNLPLTGQYWLVLKNSDSNYRALETDGDGKFTGSVQHIQEDDLLEGYMPDTAFFKKHFQEPVKKLMALLSHKKETPRRVSYDYFNSEFHLLYCSKEQFLYLHFHLFLSYYKFSDILQLF